MDDVKLASQLVLDKAFTSPPARDLLLELARGRNIAPLPLIKPHCGLRLPPDRYCLIAANYKLKTQPPPKKMVKTAIKGRVNLETQVKGNATTSTPSLKRQNTSTVTAPKTQAVTIPKPVFKFSTTAKAVPAKIKQEVKGELEEDSLGAGPAKRKREDDFDMIA